MFLFVVCVVLLSSLLVLVRALKGPTVFDRMLATNMFGTMTVVLMALLSIVMDDGMYIDVALVYAFINFITTIAFLKFFTQRSFSCE